MVRAELGFSAQILDLSVDVIQSYGSDDVAAVGFAYKDALTWLFLGSPPICWATVLAIRVESCSS